MKLHPYFSKEPKRCSQGQDFTGGCYTGTFIGSNAQQKVAYICGDLSVSDEGRKTTNSRLGLTEPGTR